MASSHTDLQEHQQRRLHRHLAYLKKNSPYYRDHLQLWNEQDSARIGLNLLPMTNKATWLEHFNTMNTQGLQAEQAFALAQQSERDRNFAPTYQGCTVGLSSGTTGARGFFVVSPEEQARWSGFILSQMLPRSLLSKERVAFFLRANSRLYESVATPTLHFKFFDLLKPFDELESDLNIFQPTIVVAPDQVLHRILQDANRYTSLNTVINVAEVLNPQTVKLANQASLRVSQVYQATEGLLATTCPMGSLHLNEEHLVVEKEYIDEHRFVPVVTDMYRKVQPVVRYRLNDVLCEDTSRCPCGRPHLRVAHIEGRQDDQLLFNFNGKTIPIFADALSRIVANTLPVNADYQIVQQGAMLHIRSTANANDVDNLAKQIQLHLHNQHIPLDHCTIVVEPNSDFSDEQHQLQTKRRRIQRISHG